MRNHADLPSGGVSTGDGYIVQVDETHSDLEGVLYTWSGSAWIYCGQIKGPKGDTGETGATGARGADGKDGTDGADGKDGTNGVDGDTVEIKYIYYLQNIITPPATPTGQSPTG